jgi:gliding motility-associated protein GldM
MAGGKLSPRQRMINMMYLVLTALLALNVSKEIINAFITLDEGIENSNQNTTAKNKLTMAAFETSMKGDPAKTKPYYERLQQKCRLI